MALRVFGNISLHHGRLYIADSQGIFVRAGGTGLEVHGADPGSKYPTAVFSHPGGVTTLALYSESTTDYGYAIDALGMLHFKPAAGMAVVPVGKSFVDVVLPKIGLFRETIVLATVQGPSAAMVKHAQKHGERRFRITLAEPVTADTTVGYLVLN